MNQERFRPARKEDCATIAALYRISSEGIADYIWTRIAEPGEDVLEVGRRRYERQGTTFSYENCTIVEVGGEIAGMLVAFPMHVDPSDEEERDPVLAPYSKLEEDASYYICGMALFPAYRGRGIGTRLLELAEAHAREKGFDKLSLLVFEHNAGARRLYQRAGYEEVDRAPLYPHPLVHHTGDVLLMVKRIGMSDTDAVAAR